MHFVAPIYQAINEFVVKYRGKDLAMSFLINQNLPILKIVYKKGRKIPRCIKPI